MCLWMWFDFPFFDAIESSHLLSPLLSSLKKSIFLGRGSPAIRLLVSVFFYEAGDGPRCADCQREDQGTFEVLGAETATRVAIGSEQSLFEGIYWPRLVIRDLPDGAFRAYSSKI